MLAFWRSIFYSSAAAPIFKTVADMLNVTPQVCKEYCTSGIMMYGTKWAIIFLLILAAIIGAIIFFGKKKDKQPFKKTSVKVLTVILGVLLVFGGTLGASTYEQLVNVKGLKNEGNSDKYNPDQYTVDPNSPLKGKVGLWLGSSVFAGFGSDNTSPALFIDAMTGTSSIIEVKGGTFLATAAGEVGGGAGGGINPEDNYVPRLMLHDKTTDPQVDFVVVQLSTNDSKGQTELGEVLDGKFEFDDFDNTTTVGALEAITAYARDTWGARTMVISGTEFQDEMTYSGGQQAPIYLAMIEACHELDEKWGDTFTFVDLWHNEEMYENVETGGDQWRIYMSDAIHPTKAGYAEWWGPYIIDALYETFGQ